MIAALCVWLAPVWLTVLLVSLTVVGFIISWIVEGIKASKETQQPA